MAEYTTLGLLAVGGMAELYLARRTTAPHGPLVVQKRIRPEYARDPDFVQMFLDEARICAALNHTNVPRVHGVGRDGDQVYFVMELLHGRDLTQVITRAQQRGVRISDDAAIEIALGMCAGLHHAHERRTPQGASLEIVHRDVSPHNVLLTFDGSVKLLDFGIAKTVESTELTATGVRKGKVPYMSPEQAYGRPLDRRSDVFSLGVVLWELTTGGILFQRGSNLEMLKAVADEDAPSPRTIDPDYPKDLERVVMKCLARRREDRFESCEAVANALEEYAAGHGYEPFLHPARRLMRTLFPREIAALEKAASDDLALAKLLLPGEAATPRSVEASYESLEVVPDATRPSPTARRRHRWSALVLALLTGAIFAVEPVATTDASPELVPHVSRSISRPTSRFSTVPSMSHEPHHQISAPRTRERDTSKQLPDAVSRRPSRSRSLAPAPTSVDPLPSPPVSPVRRCQTIASSTDVREGLPEIQICHQETP